MVIGGKRAAQGGTFFEPTVLTDVTTDMVIAREAAFDPVNNQLTLQDRRSKRSGVPGSSRGAPRGASDARARRRKVSSRLNRVNRWRRSSRHFRLSLAEASVNRLSHTQSVLV